MKFKPVSRRTARLLDASPDVDRRWCIRLVRVASTFYAGALQTTTYHIPRYRYQGCRTFTNNHLAGQPRTWHSATRFVRKSSSTRLAERLKIDPPDLRLRIVESSNAVTAEFFASGPSSRRMHSPRCEVSDWKEKFRKLPEGRGVGLAAPLSTGAGFPFTGTKCRTRSSLTIRPQRRRLDFCGATEIGQGSTMFSRESLPRFWASTRSTFAVHW